MTEYRAPEDYVLFGVSTILDSFITVIGFFFYLRSKGDTRRQTAFPIFVYYFSRFLGLLTAGVLYLFAYLQTNERHSDYLKNYGLCFYQSFGSCFPASCVIISVSFGILYHENVDIGYYKKIQFIINCLYLFPCLNLVMNIAFIYNEPLWIMINSQIFLVIFILAAVLLLVRTLNSKQEQMQNAQHSMLVHQLWLFITCWAYYIVVNSIITLLNNDSKQERYYSGFDCAFDIGISVVISVLFIVPKRVSQEYLFDLIDIMDDQDSSTQNANDELND